MTEVSMPVQTFWFMILCSFVIAMLCLVQFYYDSMTIRQLDEKIAGKHCITELTLP